MILKFLTVCLLTILVNGQAPVLPSYYNRQPLYPTSLYNSPSSYPQSNSPYSQPSSSLNAALAYQQEQQLQRQQALSSYQQQYNQQAAAAAQPLSRAPFTSNPSVNYSPQQIPAVSYQPQAAPQSLPQSEGIEYAQPQYNQPQTSYNHQGLQTISYQPSNEQPVAPAVTSYDPQPVQNQPQYNTQPQYSPEQIAAYQRQRDAELNLQRQRQQELAIQRQRENELALQKQRESEQLAAIQRQREYENNLRRQKEAEIAIQREREAALAVQAQRDAIAAQQAAAQRAAQQQAAQQQAAQQQAAQQQAAQQQAAQQQAAQQQAAQQARYNPSTQQAPASYYQPKPSPIQPTTTEAPKVVHRPAEIFYSKIGEQLNGDYTFGYHTGKGENDNSFREEKRLPDGTVTGAYGFVDKNGKKHVIKYTAGKDGFKVEGDVDPNISAASQAKLPPLEPSTEAPTYQPSSVSYRQPEVQREPAYSPQPPQRTVAPYQAPAPVTTPSPIANSYRSETPIANSYRSETPSSGASAVPSAYEVARAQVAANRYTSTSNDNRPIASAYQAPIAPSYQAPLSRQNLGQNLSYRPPVRNTVAPQPSGTHLATSATARINSRAVRKLLQTRHRQQVNPSSSIDTSASVLSSSVVQEPVKLKTSSSVQILTGPPPMVPNYSPINPAIVRSRNTVKAFTNNNIETSASSAKLSYSKEPIKNKVVIPVKQTVDKIESRSDDASSDHIESRSDNVDKIESQSNSLPIDFPTIAMNSFFGRIK